MASRGLTLIEVLIALALVTILGAIGVSSWSKMRDGLAVGAAARQVAAELALARLRSINSRLNHRLVFTVGQSLYRVQRVSGSEVADLSDPVRLPAGVSVSRCTAPEGIVSFRSRGNAGTFGSTTLENGYGDSRQVVVNMAGNVRVQ